MDKYRTSGDSVRDSDIPGVDSELTSCVQAFTPTYSCYGVGRIVFVPHPLPPSIQCLTSCSISMLTSCTQITGKSRFNFFVFSCKDIVRFFKEGSPPKKKKKSKKIVQLSCGRYSFSTIERYVLSELFILSLQGYALLTYCVFSSFMVSVGLLLLWDGLFSLCFFLWELASSWILTSPQDDSVGMGWDGFTSR